MLRGVEIKNLHQRRHGHDEKDEQVPGSELVGGWSKRAHVWIGREHVLPRFCPLPRGRVRVTPGDTRRRPQMVLSLGHFFALLRSRTAPNATRTCLRALARTYLFGYWCSSPWSSSPSARRWASAVALLEPAKAAVTSSPMQMTVKSSCLSTIKERSLGRNFLGMSMLWTKYLTFLENMGIESLSASTRMASHQREAQTPTLDSSLF